MDLFKELERIQSKKAQKKTISENVEPKIHIVIEQEKPNTILDASKILQEDSSIPSFSTAPTTGFVGAFNYVPEPSMFVEGAEYRNKNNGVVYKKVGNLWEEYVRDGRDGRSFSPVGGGCGVQEVTKIAKEQIELLGRAPFKMNKNGDGSVASITMTVSAGQYVTSALPVGPSYLFQYTGSGPFAIKTGDNTVVANQNDLPALTGLREILYITDTHISVFGVGPGQVTIVGGVGV